MILYHVTKENYNIDDTISIDNFDNEYGYYYQNSLHKATSDFLDEMRPNDEPLREKCIFAFESLTHCASFVGIKNKAKFNFYEIEIDSVRAHPMCLLTELNRTTDIELRNKLRDEYWLPQMNWKFKEFLGTNIVIIDNLIDISIGNFDDLISDQKKMKNLSRNTDG